MTHPCKTVEHWLPLIHAMAVSMYTRYRSRPGLELEDLVQEGALAVAHCLAACKTEFVSIVILRLRVKEAMMTHVVRFLQGKCVSAIKRKTTPNPRPTVSTVVNIEWLSPSRLPEPDYADVFEALPGITDRQKRYLRMYYIDGLTQLEIAKKVGVGTQQVNGQINAAIRFLRTVDPEVLVPCRM